MKISKKTFYRALIVSCSVIFTEVYSIFFAASYLPEMTLWLGYNEKDKGFYVGCIAALYCIGAVCTSYPLSWLSDQVGHRRVIIALLFAKAASCLVFAFANNLGLILIAQFCIGSCSTLQSSSRAVLSIYSSDETQTFAMALNMLAVSLGMNIGSTIGGYLASPAMRYPQYFARISFFETFPYFIPPFLATVFSVVTAAIVQLSYPAKELESSTTSNERDLGQDERTLLSSAGVISPVYDSNKESTIQDSMNLMLLDRTQTRTTNSERDILEATSTNEDKHNNTHGVYKRRIKHISEETKNHVSNDRGLCERYKSILLNSSPVLLMKNGNVMKAVIIYTLLYSVIVSYLEVFAVWASTVKNLGGLEYSTDTIGSIQMIVVFPCAILQILISPVVERRLGSINAFMVYAVICVVNTSLMPLIRMFNDVWVQWYVLLLTQVLFSTCEFGMSIASSLIVNNSVPPSQVSAVNGLTRTTSGLMRSGYCVMIGSVFTASVKSQFGSPVDPSLVFVLIGMTVWITSIVAYFIPRQLNYKYME